MSNPYDILGVAPTASLDDIKKRYRKLAKQCHPDMRPGDKSAEKRFKEISHAFDQVGTAQARAKYDRGETEDQQRAQHEELMRQQRTHGSRSSTEQGFSFGGAGLDEELLESLFRGQRPVVDPTYQLEVDFRDAALGAQKQLVLPDGRQIHVTIPAGIESGKKLRFKGLGAKGARGRARDVYVEITVNPLEGWSRQGLDLETEVPISFIEAITGGEIRIATLDGEALLKIPPGVTTGSKLRVRGKGAGAGEKRGNLLVRLTVMTPRDVPPELRAAVEKLKDTCHFNPREASG
jgi:DnaJ-class molecular chaperone